MIQQKKGVTHNETKFYWLEIYTPLTINLTNLDISLRELKIETTFLLLENEWVRVSIIIIYFPSLEEEINVKIEINCFDYYSFSIFSIYKLNRNTSRVLQTSEM